MEFQPGDVVKLKSGGPSMTVQKVEDDKVTCQWFVQGAEVKWSAFPAPMVTKAMPGKVRP